MSYHHFLRLTASSTPITQSLNRRPGIAILNLRHSVRCFGFSRPRTSEPQPSSKHIATKFSKPDSNQVPQWLLIYHASKVQTALIGAAKIFAFAFFGFTAAVLAPTFYQVGAASPDTPQLRYLFPIALLVASVTPLYVTTFSPWAYVSFVQVAIPPGIRGSRTALAAWARRIPATTRVVLTTQRASLNARQTETCMAELSLAPSTPRAGAHAESLPGVPISRSGEIEFRMERRRLPGWQPPSASARTNWFVREPRRFVVRAYGNESQEKMVWDHFVKQISQARPESKL